MNTDMHGKQILQIEVERADGNPYIYQRGYELDYKHPELKIERMELSATYHGDHDEFWVLLIGAKGEIARFNAKAPEMKLIVWEQQP